MSRTEIPDDFPREAPISVVSGYQPKIGLRRIEGKYVAGYTEDELRERYDECIRLADHLAIYCKRKAAEKNWTLEVTVQRVEQSARAKVTAGEWELSREECEWMLRQMRNRLADKAAME